MKPLHRAHFYWLKFAIAALILALIIDISAHIYSAADLASLNKTADACMMDHAERRHALLEELIQ